MHETNKEILFIKVVRSLKEDRIYTLTELPTSMPFFDDKVVAKVMVKRGAGEEYIKKHYPEVPFELIDISKGLQTKIYSPLQTPVEKLQDFEINFPATHPILRVFQDLILESSEKEFMQIDIRDVHKINMSKSLIRDLDEFYPIINYDRLNKDYPDSEAIAQSVFEAESDCIARKGEPIEIWLQEWNQVMIVMNKAGGSHRFAALRFCHLEHNEERMMDCAVTRWKLNPACISLTQQYQIWIMSVDSSDDLKLPLLHRLGIKIEKAESSLGVFYIYRKSALNSFLLDKFFRGAFNLSYFIQSLSCPKEEK